MVNIIIKNDQNGFLAEVEGYDNIYAYGDTKELAKKELLGVIEMMMDYHLEEVEKERKIKNSILDSNVLSNAF